jgi:carbamoylphosphate synthase small subunit
MRNINDDSIEAIESSALKLISIQYYPSSPGFDEVNDAFIKFMRITGVKIKRSVKSGSEVQYAKA